MKKIFVFIGALICYLPLLAQDETINGQLTVNVDGKTTLRLENDVNGEEPKIRFRAKNSGGSGGWMHADIGVVPTSSINNVGYLGFKVPFNGSFGQGYKMIINSDGDVGVGTTTPFSNLNNNGIQIDRGGHTTLLVGDGINDGGVIQSSDDKRRVFIGSNVYDDPSQSWDNFASGKSAAIDIIGESGKIRFITTSSAVGYTVSEIDMSILDNGSVGIGTETTGSHKLAVEGSIGAREIKVESSGWSDFVFEDDYDLKSLEELEQYIIENNHLPDIPTESEVKEEGINLGKMNTKLLQKVEELTLYMIEQNKRIQKLEAQNAKLVNKLNNIE